MEAYNVIASPDTWHDIGNVVQSAAENVSSAILANSHARFQMNYEMTKFAEDAWHFTEGIWNSANELAAQYPAETGFASGILLIAWGTTRIIKGIAITGGSYFVSKTLVGAPLGITGAFFGSYNVIMGTYYTEVGITAIIEAIRIWIGRSEENLDCPPS